MLPDRVSNPGPLTYESGALPIALRGPATIKYKKESWHRRITRTRYIFLINNNNNNNNSLYFQRVTHLAEIQANLP